MSLGRGGSTAIRGRRLLHLDAPCVRRSTSGVKSDVHGIGYSYLKHAEPLVLQRYRTRTFDIHNVLRIVWIGYRRQRLLLPCTAWS